METQKKNVEKKPEATIKFGKGLVGEAFMSKAGKELVQVQIPNVDKDDHRPWETFVVPANFVHDNQFGKGVWMKLPADGKTVLNREVKQGKDADGKTIWNKESREVSNKELKSMLESYKEKNRDSVLDKLSDAKQDVEKSDSHENKFRDEVSR